MMGSDDDGQDLLTPEVKGKISNTDFSPPLVLANLPIFKK